MRAGHRLSVCLDALGAMQVLMCVRAVLGGTRLLWILITNCDELEHRRCSSPRLGAYVREGLEERL